MKDNEANIKHRMETT